MYGDAEVCTAMRRFLAMLAYTGMQKFPAGLRCMAGLRVYGKAKVSGNVVIRGTAKIFGNAEISGSERLVFDGHAEYVRALEELYKAVYKELYSEFTTTEYCEKLNWRSGTTLRYRSRISLDLNDVKKVSSSSRSDSDKAVLWSCANYSRHLATSRKRSVPAGRGLSATNRRGCRRGWKSLKSIWLLVAQGIGRRKR